MYLNYKIYWNYKDKPTKICFFWENSNAIWGLFGRSCSLKILSKEAQSMASWDFHEVGPESTTLRSFYIGFSYSHLA